MTVKEIVKKYLEANGYDGLYRDNCGCTKEDLFPCEEFNMEKCEPGYRKMCECGVDWHIGPDKEGKCN